MINLVTGTPGSGKTLFVVGKLINEVGKQRIPGTDLPRPIFHNITGFRPQRIHPKDRKRIGKLDPVARRRAIREHRAAWAHVQRLPNAADVWPSLPVGSVIVIDEVQEHWSAKMTISNAPEAVLKLAVHRKQGADFWLVTQTKISRT